MATVLLSIEGVLRADYGDATIDSGVFLYHALSDGGFRVVLTTLDLSPVAQAHWLRVNGFRQHVELLHALPDDLDDTYTRMRQVRAVRGRGEPISFVVDPSTDVARECLYMGVVSMLMLNPVYVAPEARPDWTGARRPWAELVAEVERQKDMRSAEQEQPA